MDIILNVVQGFGLATLVFFIALFIALFGDSSENIGDAGYFRHARKVFGFTMIIPTTIILAYLYKADPVFIGLQAVGVTSICYLLSRFFATITANPEDSDEYKANVFSWLFGLTSLGIFVYLGYHLPLL